MLLINSVLFQYTIERIKFSGTVRRKSMCFSSKDREVKRTTSGMGAIIENVNGKGGGRDTGSYGRY